ncbi:unnamed protein product, partial [Rotaria magnacalcarata]
MKLLRWKTWRTNPKYISQHEGNKKPSMFNPPRFCTAQLTVISTIKDNDDIDQIAFQERQ